MSLTKKFVLTFLLVTLIPIVVIVFVTRQTLIEQAEQQIGTRLEDSAVQVGKSMDPFNAEVLGLLLHGREGPHNSDLSRSNLQSMPYEIRRETCLS